LGGKGGPASGVGETRAGPHRHPVGGHPAGAKVRGDKSAAAARGTRRHTAAPGPIDPARTSAIFTGGVGVRQPARPRGDMGHDNFYPKTPTPGASPPGKTRVKAGAARRRKKGAHVAPTSGRARNPLPRNLDASSLFGPPSPRARGLRG
jgi:hypothetical protein